jgi:hypothetical protein
MKQALQREVFHLPLFELVAFKSWHLSASLRLCVAPSCSGKGIIIAVCRYEAGRPENLPGPFKDINLGGLLAWEFILMHWVEVRRWQDFREFGSVNEVGGASTSAANRPIGCCQ